MSKEHITYVNKIIDEGVSASTRSLAVMPEIAYSAGIYWALEAVTRSMVLVDAKLVCPRNRDAEVELGRRHAKRLRCTDVLKWPTNSNLSLDFRFSIAMPDWDRDLKVVVSHVAATNEGNIYKLKVSFQRAPDEGSAVEGVDFTEYGRLSINLPGTDIGSHLQPTLQLRVYQEWDYDDMCKPYHKRAKR